MVYINPTYCSARYRQSHDAGLLQAATPWNQLEDVLRLDRGTLPEMLAPHYERMGTAPHIAALADAMWHHMVQGGAHAALAIDHALLAIVTSLLAAAGRPPIEAPPPRLDDRRLSRVVDYVEADLARPFTTAELAGVACLSAFHFTRAFKRATGLTPHRYVSARRVERAKGLLAATELDLASIARATGFASHSHLSAVFKDAVGAPPGRWRIAAR